MDSINQIKLNLEKAKAQRLSQESTGPKTRHTIYLGDRTIQQLGQAPIENGVVLNNQSIKIGDSMLPLAKGNVLRRVDNTNGGALLGSAYRDAVENDFDINGDRRNRELSRNGGNEPSDPNLPSTGLNYPIYPPPFGCVPPPQQCFWSTNPIAPDGFQGYGDVVLNENALPLYLYCQNGIQPPDDLGCTFLSKNKWGCSGGVCSPDPNGLYNSQAECETVTAKSVSQTYANNLGLVTIGSYPFTVTPPLEVMGWADLKVFLISGIADDFATVGSSPIISFAGGEYTGPTIQIGSGTVLTGVLTQSFTGSPCYISINLLWTGKACPI